MRKTLSLAALAAVFAAPAFAANLENPLYLPDSGDFFSKTSAGMMTKRLPDNLINQYNGTVGDFQSPVWRLREQLGYGITDRLAIQGAFRYTANQTGDRYGMDEGRLGAIYRVMADQESLLLDVYADLNLGGISKMSLDAVNNANPYTGLGFHYNNYTTGDYGIYAGARAGHTWDKFTAAAFAEVLYTLPGNNNKITTTELTNVGGVPIAMLHAQGLPDSFSVDLKNTWDWNAGVNFGYDFADTWTSNFTFTYKHHAEHVISKVHMDPANMTGYAAGVASVLIPELTTGMSDQFDEFVFGTSVAKTLNEWAQVALYTEYTADNGQWNSQNTTKFKWELGARLNVQF